jgi:hypothetical protein
MFFLFHTLIPPGKLQAQKLTRFACFSPGKRFRLCRRVAADIMINPPKVDYGLFRASRSHNPPYIRALMVLTHHSALM